MKRIVIALLLLAATAHAQWTRLTGTDIASRCPGAITNGSGSNCPGSCTQGDGSGVFSYSGAAYDAFSHRALYWGGGHNDYAGNEVYALDMSADPPAMHRLTDPPPNAACGQSTKYEAIPGLAFTTPNNGHTTGGMTVIPSIPETGYKPLLISAGRKVTVGSGNASGAIWALDASLATLPNSVTRNAEGAAAAWSKIIDTGVWDTTWNPYAASTAYDPKRHVVYLLAATTNGTSPFYKLEFRSDGTKRLYNMTNGADDPSFTPVFDPSRDVVIALDKPTSTQWLIYNVSAVTATGNDSIASPTHVALDASCGTMARSTTLTYDELWAAVVAHTPNNGSVVIFNPDATKDLQTVYGTVPHRKCLRVYCNTTTCSTSSVGGVKGTDYPPDPVSAIDDGPAMYGRFMRASDVNKWIASPLSTQDSWTLTLDHSAPNTATIYSTEGQTAWANSGGTTQTNRVISESRVFRDGDIPKCAQAYNGATGLPTQCNVITRWDSGAVKHAILTYTIASLTGAGVTITFQNDAACPASGDCNASSPLTVSAVLADSAYDLDAVIHADNGSGVTHDTSAKTLLQAGKYTTWFSGPQASAWIVRDLTRASDFKMDALTGTPLSPGFEIWCWSGDKHCEIGAWIENAWFSNTAGNSSRNQTYSYTLSVGSASPTVKISQASFTHYSWTRWHEWRDRTTKKPLMTGTTQPGALHIDHNGQYLASTKLVPNYDFTRDVSTAATNFKNAWQNPSAGQQTYTGSSGACNTGSWGVTAGSCLGELDLSPNTGGPHEAVGPLPSHDVLYLLTQDATLQDESWRTADLYGLFPMHYREADPGRYYDYAGTVDAQYKIISVNARPGVYLNQIASSASADRPNLTVGTATDGNNRGPWTSSTMLLFPHHAPGFVMPFLTTGRYFYLEEMQFKASSNFGTLNYPVINDTSSYTHEGNKGLCTTDGLRGSGWCLRDAARAAALSPISDEKTYVTQKLNNNLAFLAGSQGLANDFAGNTEATASYTFGSTWLSGVSSYAPLAHFVQSLAADNYCGQSALLTTYCGLAMSNFQESYLAMGTAMARELGFAGTDNLVSLLARRPTNVVLNPSVGNMYLVGTYNATDNDAGYAYATRDCTSYSGTPGSGGYCATIGAPMNYAGNWSLYSGSRYFTSTPTSWYGPPSQMEDFVTAEVAASLAMMADKTVPEGYSAGNAYAMMRNTAQTQVWTQFGIKTPKFDIVPRSVGVASYVPLTTYYLTCNASPSAGGTCNGAGYYAAGTNAYPTYTANPGYHFTTWSDGCTADPCVVTMNYPKITVTANFAADANPLTSISVSPASPSIVAGNTQPFTAQCTYQDTTTGDCTATVVWSSSNTAIATITGGSPGVATGVSAGGPITITATDTPSGVSGTASLTVTAPSSQVPTSISGSVVIGGSAVIH